MLCNTNNKTTPIERRDPVPHRGFNAKAREVLLDSEKSRYWEFLSRSIHKTERAKMCPTNNSNFRRCGSDEEFLRRVRFGRTESEGCCSNGGNGNGSGGGSGGNGSGGGGGGSGGNSSVGSRGSISIENKIKGIKNVKNEQFDGIDDLPKLENKLKKLKNRTLQEIGKSLSAYDLNN
ncbi:hypothetical protein Mgra_00007367 [Meloidogyne graminicola]|uniref:Uncharacterized protein n=1 Tax=Meloidogyne graminicola TaxID=189291 RepID=A0A8S9ZIY6_9BILA|nr:hypothetical protein Mgra_00007367 [Meloidogyne graminicola]